MELSDRHFNDGVPSTLSADENHAFVGPSTEEPPRGVVHACLLLIIFLESELLFDGSILVIRIFQAVRIPLSYWAHYFLLKDDMFCISDLSRLLQQPCKRNGSQPYTNCKEGLQHGFFHTSIHAARVKKNRYSTLESIANFIPRTKVANVSGKRPSKLSSGIVFHTLGRCTLYVYKRLQHYCIFLREHKTPKTDIRNSAGVKLQAGTGATQFTSRKNTRDGNVRGQALQMHRRKTCSIAFGDRFDKNFDGTWRRRMFRNVHDNNRPFLSAYWFGPQISDSAERCAFLPAHFSCPPCRRDWEGGGEVLCIYRLPWYCNRHTL